MHLKAAISESKKRFGAWIRGGYSPEPISAWEWTLMRLGFACLVMWEFRDWHAFDFAGQPSPVGVARLVDLSWLHSARPFGFSMFQVTLGLAAICCLAYVCNFALRWVLPVLALAHAFALATAAVMLANSASSPASESDAAALSTVTLPLVVPPCR